MPSPIPKLPALRKRYFEHGLAHTKKNQTKLLVMANKLVEERKKLGITQVQLAKKVGCSRNTLNHIENAENFASLPLYWELCEKLGQGKPPLT